MILDSNNYHSAAWNDFHAEPQTRHLWRSHVHMCFNNKTVSRSGLIAIHTLFHCTNTANDVTITSSKTTQLPLPDMTLPTAGCLITHTPITTEYFGHCWHKNIRVFPRQLQEGACFPTCKRVPFTLLDIVVHKILGRFSYELPPGHCCT